jgi:hypothetical protein
MSTGLHIQLVIFFLSSGISELRHDSKFAPTQAVVKELALPLPYDD